MSSPQNSSPNSDFQNRLNRLADARAEAPQTYVSAVPSWRENIKYPASLVAAALVGMAAVLVARYVRFHITGGTLAGQDADITMLIDGGIAVACSFLLFSVFRFSGTAYKSAQTVGITIMVMGMHNLVHLAPGVFDTLFTPEWTEEAIAFTEPNSILFRGASFVLIEPETTVAGGSGEIPLVRRAGQL